MNGGEARGQTQNKLMLILTASSLLKKSRQFVLKFSKLDHEADDKNPVEKTSVHQLTRVAEDFTLRISQVPRKLAENTQLDHPKSFSTTEH
ncbi:MAG: hypothetical protein WBH50_09520 [Fuerstiella sp.]|jgi:hypothetical protein